MIQENVKRIRRMSLASTLICLIVSVFLLIGVAVSFAGASLLAGGAGRLFSRIEAVDRDSVVAGYDVLFSLFGGMVGGALSMVLYVLGILLVLAFLLTVVQAIAGFIFLEKNKRCTAKTPGPSAQGGQPYQYLKADAVLKLVLSSLLFLGLFLMMLTAQLMPDGILLLLPSGAVAALSGISLFWMK